MVRDVETTVIRTPSVPALQRGLAIIELLSDSPKGLTLPQVSRKLGIPKSTTHCLLLTLERTGYLTRSTITGRYRLGLKLAGLAGTALAHVGLREFVRPHVQQLAKKTSLTVHVGVLENNEAVILDKIEGPGAQHVATWPGKRMDVHCTALGKALLTGVDNETFLRVVNEHGLPRHNENTIASVRRLREEINKVRERGFAMEDEEDEIGCRCLGAGIRNAENQVVAAVSVSGTINEVHAGNADRLSRLLLSCVSRISAALKHQSESVQSTGRIHL
ncbi:MAG: IclR family transcriptional regulator [Bryobacterales bacterium]|nr:IclR family transcriptional regulator [Bryobacterales bacterium]